MPHSLSKTPSFHILLSLFACVECPGTGIRIILCDFVKVIVWYHPEWSLWICDNVVKKKKIDDGITSMRISDNVWLYYWFGSLYIFCLHMIWLCVELLLQQPFVLIVKGGKILCAFPQIYRMKYHNVISVLWMMLYFISGKFENNNKTITTTTTTTKKKKTIWS